VRSTAPNFVCVKEGSGSTTDRARESPFDDLEIYNIIKYIITSHKYEERSLYLICIN